MRREWLRASILLGNKNKRFLETIFEGLYICAKINVDLSWSLFHSALNMRCPGTCLLPRGWGSLTEG
jgi:hypothetical protein